MAVRARTRWGDETRVDNDEEAHRRLVDAAEACFERYGVPKTTVEDIAAEAKVSRSTVYRYFDGREAILVAVLLREGEQLFEEATRMMSAAPTFADAVVEGILFTVDAIRNGRYLKLLFDPDALALTISAATTSRAFLDNGRNLLLPFFDGARRHGELPPGLQLDDLIEWVMRTIFSLLTVESSRGTDVEGDRRLLQTFLLPALRAPVRHPKRSTTVREPTPRRR